MKNNPEPVRPDLERAIHAAFPKNEILAQPKFDDSHLAQIYDKVRHRLAQITGAEILYERDSDGMEDSPYIGSPAQWDEDEPDYPPGPSGVANYTSYHLFFLGLKDPKFTYECTLEDEEIEEEEEDESHADDLGTQAAQEEEDEAEEEAEDAEEEVAASEPVAAGQGWIGCVAALSLVAPFALVKLDAFEAFENGDYSAPELEEPPPGEGHSQADMEEDLRASMGEEAVQAAHALRTQILSALHSCGIEPLPPAEGRKELPWLARGEADTAQPHGEVTVENALFFATY